VNLDELRAYLAAPAQGRLYFDSELLWNLHLAVTSKPFVVLAGVPGVGKTSLALGYARFVTQGYEHPGVRLLHVRPEWNDSTTLMGHFDETAQGYATTPFLDMLLSALRDPEHRYFIVLDGLDAAPAERFLGDYLCGIGAAWPLTLHARGRCVARAGAVREEANLVCHDNCSTCFFSDQSALPGRLPSVMANFVPPSLRIPRNFVVLATVQSEEWQDSLPTHLLDRCHVVALDRAELAPFFAADGPGAGLPAPDAQGVFCRLADLLAAHDLGVGYRAVRESLDGVALALERGRDGTEALDRQVEQRVVPRLAAALRRRPDRDGVAEALTAALRAEGLVRAAERLRSRLAADGDRGL